MNYTIVGLFPSQENIQEVSAGIEKSGISGQDYIIYRTDQKNTPEMKKNFFSRLFNVKKNAVCTLPDHLLTSVSIKTEEELKNVTQAFQDSKVVKIYEFKDMTLDEAKDLDYIKKIVRLRAKSQIYGMPEISLSGNLLNDL